MCIKNGFIFDATQNYRAIPLPSPKTLWHAQTQSAWEIEREFSRNIHENELVTLGDLIDAQISSHEPAKARKLDKWNAGIDSMGSLLNLVGSM